jgi:hypothetical protein
MGTRERHSGLEEDVDAVWLAGCWLVQMLTGHGGHGLPVIGGHGWFWGRVPESDGCGLHEKVGACGTVGLVWALISHGGRGRRSKADMAGTGNRYRGKDGGKVMADTACRS